MGGAAAGSVPDGGGGGGVPGWPSGWPSGWGADGLVPGSVIAGAPRSTSRTGEGGLDWVGHRLFGVAGLQFRVRGGGRRSPGAAPACSCRESVRSQEASKNICW